MVVSLVQVTIGWFSFAAPLFFAKTGTAHTYGRQSEIKCQRLGTLSCVTSHGSGTTARIRSVRGAGTHLYGCCTTSSNSSTTLKARRHVHETQLKERQRLTRAPIFSNNCATDFRPTTPTTTVTQLPGTPVGTSPPSRPASPTSSRPTRPPSCRWRAAPPATPSGTAEAAAAPRSSWRPPRPPAPALAPALEVPPSQEPSPVVPTAGAGGDLAVATAGAGSTACCRPPFRAAAPAAPAVSGGVTAG